MKILVIGMCGNSLFYNKETNTLMKEEPGGKGYNQAVAIAKLGGDVSFLGAIGNDLSGSMCSNYLDSVSVNNCLIKKDIETTYATIYVDKDGNNEINVVFGAKLEDNDIVYIKQEIDKHQIVMLQNEIDVNLNIEIIKYVKKTNKYLLINPAPIASWLVDYLDDINFITPNEEEARVLFSIPSNVRSLEIGNYLVSKGYNNILVTIGSNGAILVTNNDSKHFPAHKVKAIDTTGAGDLMNACIGYGLQNNMKVEESIILGTKACAYSVAKRYVLDSYPYLKDIK